MDNKFPINQLPNELLSEIMSHMPKINLFFVSLVCKLWYSLSAPYIKLVYIKKFLRSVPDQMINVFGGTEEFIDRCGEYLAKNLL